MSAQVSIQLFHIPEIPSVRVAVLDGQVDESNLDQMRSAFDPLVGDAAVRYLVLDMAKLTFINSKTIGYLAALYSRLSEQSKKMLFAQPSETVRDIVDLVGLTKIIPAYDSLQEAIDIVRSDQEQAV